MTDRYSFGEAVGVEEEKELKMLTWEGRDPQGNFVVRKTERWLAGGSFKNNRHLGMLTVLLDCSGTERIRGHHWRKAELRQLCTSNKTQGST